MEQTDISTSIAGIDVGKFRLDAAIAGRSEQIEAGNDAAGIAALIDWLRAGNVGCVGLEASGGYERPLKLRLEAEGFEVVRHQPMQVRLFARLTLRHAKTDRLDARLIAAATAALGRPAKPTDPRLEQLAERLSAYEQVSGQLTDLRIFRQGVCLADLAQALDQQIAQLRRLKAELGRVLISAIKAAAPLRARYELLTSLPGIGPIVAASLLVRMPELGQMQRGQPASLIGVAPHARDSGRHKGQRFIAGGRTRPRRMLYLAAMAAVRCDASLKAFATRLKQTGKPPKLAIVAVMRKLIEAANIVLKRQTPWTK